MNFYELFVRAPVDGSAAGMLTASSDIEQQINREELKFLIVRLMRKRRLLNQTLAIKTNAQKKNLTYKLNRGKRTYRSSINPRAVDEWRRNGYAIGRLQAELSRRKKET